MNRDNDMGRNAEHYADPTPAAAMKNIRKDERQKDAATLLLTASATWTMRRWRGDWCPMCWMFLQMVDRARTMSGTGWSCRRAFFGTEEVETWIKPILSSSLPHWNH